MEINHQAPLVGRRETFIEASPEVVWRVHTAINDWPQWHPGVDIARLEGPLDVGSRFQWKSGGLTINSTIRMLEPNQQIGWTGKALGTRARHVWQLRPHDGGTMLTTEESMEGWLVSLLKLFTPKFLEKSLDTWVQSLKRKAESTNSLELTS